MRRYVGRSEGKRRDSRTARAGFAGVAARAMSQLYRLMAEAAESGDYRNFLQVAVVPGRRWPNATKPWRGFMRDGAGLAGLGLASAVTERSDIGVENCAQAPKRELTHWTQ